MNKEHFYQRGRKNIKKIKLFHYFFIAMKYLSNCVVIMIVIIIHERDTDVLTMCDSLITKCNIRLW